MLDPRTIALQGVGYSPLLMILQGYVEAEITVEPIFPQGGPNRRREDPEKYQVTFRLKFNNKTTVETFTLSEGPVFLALKNSRFKSKPIKITARFIK